MRFDWLKFVALLTMIIVAVILVLILSFGMSRVKLDEPPELQIGLLILIGLVVLILMLALLTQVFAQMSLSNKDEALGLPSGSIRALIALFLLLLFGAIGI